MSTTYAYYTLDNGLRIVIEVMPDVPSAAAGFLSRTGSRDETPELAGVSHYLEHMMFKGTQRRNWRQINVEFDAMGSTYNAFTSHDRTFYFGWVAKENLDRQIELLADMMRSALPPEEFDMEKNVILEEIAMSKDRIESVAVDLLLEKVYPGHALSWPILGYDTTVGGMERDRMYEYFQRRYAPDNLVLIVAGNVDPEAVRRMAEQHCGDWQPAGTNGKRQAPTFQPGLDRVVMDRFQQQIVAIAYPAVPGTHELAETASAASVILGGDNSRFFWNICQTGISPRAGSFHYDWQDCGLMILWGMCDPENADRLLAALREESKKLMTQPVAEHEVARVKNKRRTSLAAEGEAPYHRLTQIMDDVDYRGKARTVEERLAEVDAVTPTTIRNYLEQYPIHDGGHLVSVGPRDWPRE